MNRGHDNSIGDNPEFPSVTFGQLEAGMAGFHRIADDKRTQFQARLRKFQRLGLGKLDGTPPKSRAALFGPYHVIEFAYALELTELGLSPEQVVRTIKLSRHDLALGVGRVSASMMKEDLDSWEEPGAKPILLGDHTLLVLPLNALSSLTKSDDVQHSIFTRSDPVGVYSSHRDASILLGWLKSSDRVGIINLTNMSLAAWRCFPARSRQQFSSWAYGWARETAEDSAQVDLGADFLAAFRAPTALRHHPAISSFTAEELVQLLEAQLDRAVLLNRCTKSGNRVELRMPHRQRVVFDFSPENHPTHSSVTKRIAEIIAETPIEPDETQVVVLYIAEEIRNVEIAAKLQTCAVGAAPECGRILTGVLGPLHTEHLVMRIVHALRDHQTYRSIFEPGEDNGDDQEA